MPHCARTLIGTSLLTLLTTATLSAQTLFTCDGRPVSKSDFLKAYSKNNNSTKATDKSYREYLDLYVRYKLKVRAAYDQQLDTIQGQRAELQNFHSQVSGNYLKDEATLEKMTAEVFNRGKNDLHLSHIFISLPRNAAPADTAKAFAKAWAAYNELKKGKSFREEAIAFSEDPSAVSNGGDIGYITVFSLPYELENLAWSTPVGQYSKPWRSKAGYHIFSNMGERKSSGRVKVAQILLAIPPGASASIREEARQKADSVYQQLLKGADFVTLAKSYSGDNQTYQLGGEMPEFGIGKYDPAFEAAAFALEKDGAISRPIATSFGYHIIKRIYRKPFPSQWNKETETTLRQEVMSDPRVELSKKALLNKIWQQAGLRKASISETDLWAYTDSALVNKSLGSFRGLEPTTILFSLNGQSWLVKDWIDFAAGFRNLRLNNGSGAGKILFDQFLEKASLEYYRAHLEEYNADFAAQLQEFKEGNLLFEIMQRKVWDKASTDSAGLRKYYEAHKDKYWWDSSADALLFTCSDEKSALALRTALQKSPIAWRQLADSAGPSVQADSGRYELAQIPGFDKIRSRPGSLTELVAGKGDNTFSFAFVRYVYYERSPRNFRDARGFVINDYQSWLEDQWIAELKKKYPVNIDERVLASLPK